MMEKVTNLSVSKLEKSRFIQPLRLHYTQNEIEKVWDMGSSHESVAIVIYNTSKETFVMVKQLRPAVLFAEVTSGCTVEDLDKVNAILKDLPNDIGRKGITLELCAGIVDKAKSLSQIGHLAINILGSLFINSNMPKLRIIFKIGLKRVLTWNQAQHKKDLIQIMQINIIYFLVHLDVG